MSLETMPSPTPLSDEQIRLLAHDILARSPYADWRPQGRFDLLFRILDWLNRWRLSMHHLAATRPILYAVLVGAMFLAAVLLLVRLVYTLRLALVASRHRVVAQARAHGTSFLDEADALAHGGRFLDAAQRVQLAVLELLLRRRVLDLARSDPNRTLRARLQAAPLPERERSEILALLDRLERQWFRDRADDRTLYDAWCRVHERVRGLPESA